MFSGAPSRPEAVRPVNFNSGAIGDGSGNGEGGISSVPSEIDTPSLDALDTMDTMNSPDK